MGFVKKYYNFGIIIHFIILLTSLFLNWFFNFSDFYHIIFQKMSSNVITFKLYVAIFHLIRIFLVIGLISLMCILSKLLKNKLPIIGIIIFVICLLYFFNETSKGRDAYSVFYVGYPLYIFSIALLITSIIHLLILIIKKNK